MFDLPIKDLRNNNLNVVLTTRKKTVWDVLEGCELKYKKREIYMAFERNSTVSIVKCNEHDNYNLVKEAVKKSLDLIGGLESIISLGDRVLIKPNLIAPLYYTTGTTTNPHIIKAVAELSKAAGAREIVIADGSAVGNNAAEALEVCGIKSMANELGYKTLDITKDEFVYVMNPVAKIFKKIRLPKIFIESDVVINLPVMKTHDALGVTLGLKNMKGIIHLQDKKRFHKWGLAQCIVDLNHLVLPQLTLIDGTIAMEGSGPKSGEPVGLGLILASKDTVAGDRVACEIMGFEPYEVEYIRQCGEEGLGNFELKDIKIVGEDLKSVIRPFKRSTLDMDKLKELGIKLIACDACSGCELTIKNYLIIAEKKGILEQLKRCTLVYGQNPSIPEGETGKVIRIGTCTKSLQYEGSTYIPGCPPHAHHFDDKLIKY